MLELNSGWTLNKYNFKVCRKHVPLCPIPSALTVESTRQVCCIMHLELLKVTSDYSRLLKVTVKACVTK